MSNKILSLINLFMTNLPVFIIIMLYIIKKYQLLFTLLLIVTIVEIIKYITNFLPKNSYFYKMSRRPKSNANCGLICYKKLAKLDDPGFPSGHMTFMTFFVLCLPDSFEYNLIKIILVGLTSFNRISTQCHTSLQVLFGIILAFVMKILL